MFTSKVWTDDSRLLQESNFAALQPQGTTSRHTGKLPVKDLPKASMWRLEVESNQRPSTPKAQTTTTQPTMPQAILETWPWKSEVESLPEIIRSARNNRIEFKHCLQWSIIEANRVTNPSNKAPAKWPPAAMKIAHLREDVRELTARNMSRELLSWFCYKKLRHRLTWMHKACFWGDVALKWS